MKVRHSIFWLVTLIAILIGLTLWFGKKRRTETTPTASLETTGLPTSNIAAPKQHPREPPQTNAPPSLPLPGNKTVRTIGVLGAYNDIDIFFYGKVEDQFSNAVANAAVNFSVRVYNGTESTAHRGQVMTDANGLFTISGYTGESLGVAPAKAGYALATTDTLFKYSHLEAHPYEPNHNSPAIIKMWKRQGAEPLVSISQHYKLHYTNAPMNFDLLAGQIVPSGGDLRITISRPQGIISGRNRLDWSVEVEAVDGGLIDSGGQEAITYAAPDGGYRSSITIAASTNGHGIELIQQGLFLQSRNSNVYSKVTLSFRINSDPNGLMYINVDGVANTNGSRNWEATAPQ